MRYQHRPYRHGLKKLRKDAHRIHFLRNKKTNGAGFVSSAALIGRVRRTKSLWGSPLCGVLTSDTLKQHMETFAHRGMLDEYPENSLSALREAFRRGFGIETDLRLTKDNDFLIIHDDTFLKTANVRRRVIDATLREAEEISYYQSAEHLIS